MAGDGPSMMPDFQQPMQWGSNNRQTPPNTALRNSPHHRVMPKNEKISTSLEELLLGPGGRECDGPNNSLAGRRASSSSCQRRGGLLKRQNSGGRASLDNSGGVSPDGFPGLTSPGLHLGTSPHYPTPSPKQLVSPTTPYPMLSPGHSTVTSPSPSLSLTNIKMEPFETKPAGTFMPGLQSMASGPRMSVNSVHAVTSGKPSLSALKAQLEMKNDVTLSGCNISQDKDLKQDENSNSSTGSQPPLMKLKLSTLRGSGQYDSISPADSEDSSKARSCTFDFHSDDEDTLPMVDKIMVVSASPTRLQISNKTTLASFNKFNKSEKFKRKEREKELKRVALEEGVGKRKRDRDGERRERKKKRVSNNTYSVENEMAVYKSTTVDVVGSTENNKYKPMPKLKITKSGIKTIENNSVQVKELKPVEKEDSVKIEKLDKQAVVKIEKVEKYTKKEKDKDSSVVSKSVKENREVKESKERVTDKVGDKVNTPVSKSSSVSDHEGIFDRINAMKTENVTKGDNSDSVSEKNSPLSSHTVNSKKSLSVKSKTSHKSQRSNSSTKSDVKITRTPTIKLKPIVVPQPGAGSAARTPSTPTVSAPSTPKSVSQSPTSATIGKIGAVSLATSGSQKPLMPSSSSGKSPQAASSKASSATTPSSKSSTSASPSILSSKSTNSSQKNIQAQNTSGKNSPIPQSNKSRSLSSSSLNSMKLEKSKSLSSSNCRTSSPLSEREKKLNSSSRSSSSSGRDRDRDREKSTSSSKNSVPDKTIITQETAASVLSFLNPKPHKIASLPPIPKLSSASGGQKASTPTSSTNTTIVSASSISTNATTSPSNTTSKFSKGTNSTSSYNKGVNSNTVKNSSSSLSSSQKSSHSFNKSSSNSYSSNSHNKPHNSAVTNTVNASRSGNNSPVNYTQKNSANSYNKGNNQNSANSSAFRNSSSNNVGHNRSLNMNSSGSSGQTNRNNSSSSGSVSPHKGSNSSGSGNHKGSNSASSGNRGGTSATASSSGAGNRPSSAASSASSMRGSNTGPNAPKGPGPPVPSKRPGSSSEAEEVKVKSSHSSQPPAGNRGRKGSLSAVIDKLTCKATIPPYSNTSTNSNKGDKVIIDESPASPEPEASSVEKNSDKKDKKIVIFDAPASPEPDNSSVCNSVEGFRGSTGTGGDKIVSIPLDQQLSQNSDTGSKHSGETLDIRESDIPEKILPKSVKSDLSSSSPKVIPLELPKDSHSHTKSPFNKHLTKQRSLDSMSPQQNGDISSDESAKLKVIEKSTKHNDNASKAQVDSGVTEHTIEGSHKGSSQKNMAVIDSKLGQSEDSAKRKPRSNTSVKAICSPESPPSSPENGLMIDCPLSPGQLQNSTNSPQCNSMCDSGVIGDRTSPTFLKSVSLKTSQARMSSGSPVEKEGMMAENSSANSPCFLDDDLMDEALGLGN